MKVKGFIVMAICAALIYFGASCTRTRGPKLVAPEEGLYQGAFPDLPEEPGPRWKMKIEAYQSLVGKKLAWATLINDFTDGPVFPAEAVAQTLDAGTLPFIRILPRSKRVQEQGQEPLYQLTRIAKGEFDAEIRQWCREAAAVRSPLLAEFGQEANGDWYGWGGYWNGAGGHTSSRKFPDGPYHFREAFRHFIALCREEHADNLTWFFHLDSQPRPVEKWNKMAYYYPGDDYIDWIGLSVFGAQKTSDYWATFAETMDPAYAEMAAVSKTKPMAVLEMGVIENPKDPMGKANWLKAALTALRSGKYPRVKAVNYWHERSWVPTGDNDFRVDSTLQALQTFIAEIGRVEFLSEPVFSK